MLRTFSATLFACVFMAGNALAQDAATKPMHRGGGAVQFELASGGDDLYNDETHASRTNLGQGGTLSLGGFYRPMENSPFELQAFVGFKVGWAIPVTGGGGDADVSRWVVQLLGNYRNNEKWYVGGGLVLHLNPKYVDDYPGAVDVDFDNAAGALVEAGWNWVGLQCTYMKYHTDVYGSFDASNCGIRFTFRFRKWRPIS